MRNALSNYKYHFLILLHKNRRIMEFMVITTDEVMKFKENENSEETKEFTATLQRMGMFAIYNDKAFLLFHSNEETSKSKMALYILDMPRSKYITTLDEANFNPFTNGNTGEVIRGGCING
ncbi:MAG: hypothetical protein KAS32_01760 [Candidatus Peribacteraceae bacterium]|nr:hypothetical protein [Candidatus Peribacteraceae bacterium]